MLCLLLGIHNLADPGGWLADRVGGKRVVGFGAIWWSLLHCSYPLGRGAAGMMAFRFLLGLGEGVNSQGYRALSRAGCGEERTRAVTLYLTGGPLGTIVALPLSTWIIASWGWRAVFYISSRPWVGVGCVLVLATADSAGDTQAHIRRGAELYNRAPISPRPEQKEYRGRD